MRFGKSRQQGLTLLSFIFISIILVIVTIFALKIVPAFLQHNTISSMVRDATHNKQSVQEIRSAFDRFCDVNHIESVTSKDLVITKEKDSNQFTTEIAYTKVIEMTKNSRLEIDFKASSKDK